MIADRTNELAVPVKNCSCYYRPLTVDAAVVAVMNRPNETIGWFKYYAMPLIALK